MGSAAATDVTLDQLMFDGEQVDKDVSAHITSARLRRTIEGAPTLDLGFQDDNARSILSSGLLSTRLSAQLDGRSFMLAKVNKSAGRGLTVTMEDLTIASLRPEMPARKVEGGTMTRVDFARMLLEETPWVPLIVSPTVRKDLAKVELARGTPSENGSEEEKESTWECLHRIFREVGWRCYIDKGADGRSGVNVGPDAEYLRADPVMTLSEDSDVVDTIEFDWDTGKPIATATVQMRMSRWTAPPGTPVAIVGQGPADGKWIVSSIERSLFSTTGTAELTAPQPELPEPDPPASELEGVETVEGGGQSISRGAAGRDGYSWPVNGSVSSEFGPRKGRQHNGIDIAAPEGTPVGAAKGGTVSATGNSGSAGNYVYIKHAKGESTRYLHLSSIAVTRGQQVSVGQKIGAVGSTGNASGPHLHFERRVNNQAVNPRTIL